MYTLTAVEAIWSFRSQGQHLRCNAHLLLFSDRDRRHSSNLRVSTQVAGDNQEESHQDTTHVGQQLICPKRGLEVMVCSIEMAKSVSMGVELVIITQLKQALCD